ncbi:CrcB protein [Gracilibacillus orientalis]|uniref:Fluoride-specific ion channel FluC n=1 Tax=Gracilibacillus orientalis TaxID=334253 RepID=A0A1I4QHS3_9BACI|nr:CrcB family protein [Gracilibacillus orientalis]SFM39235.1 CrcB protein [Gracilibacillus orientalis]
MSIKAKQVKLFLAVGIGGVLGALLRYIIAESVSFISLPIGTTIANLIGCFVLAYAAFHPFFKNKLPPYIFTAFTTGLLGSFTTFSTFIAESVLLLDKSMTWLILYLSIQIFGGVGLCFIGARLAISKEKIV